MSEQRTPGEDDVRRVYVYAMRVHGYPQGQPDAEFDRFLARVRRDAARSALDGLARHTGRLADAGLLGEGTAKIQRAAAVIATEYRDTHYPETED